MESADPAAVTAALAPEAPAPAPPAPSSSEAAAPAADVEVTTAGGKDLEDVGPHPTCCGIWRPCFKREPELSKLCAAMSIVYLSQAAAGTFQVAMLFCGYLPTTHDGLMQTNMHTHTKNEQMKSKKGRNQMKTILIENVASIISISQLKITSDPRPAEVKFSDSFLLRSPFQPDPKLRKPLNPCS